MIPAVAGLTVTILLLAMGAQVMVGLYATSTLRAVLHDAASRAASSGVVSSGTLGRLADEAEGRLGQMGRRTEITLGVVDVDGDGAGDVVVGRAVSRPPRLVPSSIGGMVGFEQIDIGVRVRIERLR